MSTPDSKIKTVKLQDIKDVLDSISSKIKDVSAEAYVFGSVIDGSAVYGESDLDILIIPFENREKLDWYSLLEDELFKLLDKGIVLHVHIADNESYGNMIRIARRDGFRIL